VSSSVYLFPQLNSFIKCNQNLIYCPAAHLSPQRPPKDPQVIIIIDLAWLELHFATATEMEKNQWRAANRKSCTRWPLTSPHFRAHSTFDSDSDSDSQLSFFNQWVEGGESGGCGTLRHSLLALESAATLDIANPIVHIYFRPPLHPTPLFLCYTRTWKFGKTIDHPSDTNISYIYHIYL